MTIDPTPRSATVYVHPTFTSFGAARFKPYYGEGNVQIATAPTTGVYDSYAPSNIESPIQPPWRILSWPRTACVCHAAVKPVAHPADVTRVGRTLDVFV